MAASTIVDAGFLIALLIRRDKHHKWAAAQASEHALPWLTCEAALSEVFYVLGQDGIGALGLLLSRQSVRVQFSLAHESGPVLALMQKYSQVPMSFADACLVRMTEILPDPVVLSVDSDFRIYRRHGRQVVPCILPE